MITGDATVGNLSVGPGFTNGSRNGCLIIQNPISATETSFFVFFGANGSATTGASIAAWRWIGGFMRRGRPGGGDGQYPRYSHDDQPCLRGDLAMRSLIAGFSGPKLYRGSRSGPDRLPQAPGAGGGGGTPGGSSTQCQYEQRRGPWRHHRLHQQRHGADAGRPRPGNARKTGVLTNATGTCRSRPG